MLKTFNISLDLESKTSPKPFTVNQNDLNTLEVNINLTNNKKPLNITGMTPRIVIKKPSYLTVIQDCEVISAVTGSIKLVLNTQAYSEAGSHQAELYLYEGENVLVTETFSYMSNKAILNDKAFKSSNDWQSINDAFIKIDDGISRIENADVYTKSEADVKLAEKAKQTDVNNALGLKSDKTYVDGELAKKASATELTVKADKTYVDSQLSGKATNADLSTTNANVTANANAIGLKADKIYVDTSLADKASQVALNTTNANVSANTAAISDLASQVGVSTENKFTYSYNANGDIQTVTEKSKTDVLISTTTYTYKANGDVDTSVKVSGSTTLTTTYIYDANGNLTDTVSVKS